MNNSESTNKSADIDITVISLTYNHEDYINKCMEGIWMQEVSCTYEVIVYDDCSQDATRNILMEFSHKHPSDLRLLLSDKNQFSKQIDYFSDIVRNKARGKYIALCEGDDYWNDKNKLQLQYEALEAHPECDMCACRAEMISEDGGFFLGEIRPKTEDTILPIEDVILGGGNYIASAGLFFRRSMFEHMMEFEKIRSLDYSHQMKGALRGGIYYIDRPMAVYRRYSKSSVTSTITSNNDAMKMQCDQEKAILRTLDQETGEKYHEVIMDRLRDYETGFYEQLKKNSIKIRQIVAPEMNKKIYVWGMGLRGKELERFLTDENIRISGVCDITDSDVGGTTSCGNRILSHDEVMCNEGVILASVTGAYDYLIKHRNIGVVINMQEYMPRA